MVDPTAAAIERLVEAVRAALSARDDVLEAYVFGSRARGEASGHSDLDVAVTLDRSRPRDAPFGDAAELTTLLMAALGTNEIDVVILNDAPPLLYHRVLRDGVRVSSRDLAATTTREGRALSRYCDYVPQLAKIEIAARERRA